MRISTACAALLAVTTATTLALATPGPRDDARAQVAAGSVTAEPQLGIGANALLLGSAPQGATGDPSEAWALAFRMPAVAPIAGGQSLSGTVLLMRYTEADGWTYAHSAARADGTGAYTGGEPLARERSGRVTRRGGLALVVGAPGGSRRATLVVGDRGQRPRAVTPPGVEILPDPEAPGIEREFLSPTILAAIDDPTDRTTAFVSVEGRMRQRAVARYGDDTWSREPICAADAAGVAPTGCAADETLQHSANVLDVVALSAAGSGAWLLARTDPAAAPDDRRGLALFERTVAGGGPRWVLRDIGAPLFERGDPARGVTDVRAIASGSALTATADGVWLDATFLAQGVQTDLTLFYNGQPAGAGRTTSWCDAAGICDHALGLRFGDRYRSFAWAGGARVVTAALARRNEPDAYYATLEGTTFVRRPHFSALGQGAAFAAPDEGWIGTSHITRRPRQASRMALWPVPVRRPLTAIVGAPGTPSGEIGSPALAVGLGGAVLRYAPGRGWDAEPLLGTAGASRDNLRGVAWPSEDFAFAVGDEGAMWRWRRSTGLWEDDPGAPFDFQGNLTGVAFAAGNPERGYAVGRQGTLLRYDKSWTAEQLPAALAAAGPGGGPADLLAVAFAGPQALVAAGSSLLVNNGGAWAVDPEVQSLLDQTGGRLNAVAGLPDGGAVAAGRGVVLARDGGPGAPWRLVEQPVVIGDPTITALAAVREGDRVRALVALNPSTWPLDIDTTLPVTDPDLPPPRATGLTPSPVGLLVREAAGGWRDEERTLFGSPGADGARRSEPVAGFLLDSSGRGWIVGGSAGLRDGQSLSADGDQAVASTASVARYSPDGGAEASPQRGSVAVATEPGRLRLLVGGHAQCEGQCAQSGLIDIMPDRTLARAVAQAGELGAQAGGPRALLYTGGRVPADPAGTAARGGELGRLAELLGAGASRTPVFGTVAPADSAAGSAQPFQAAFAGFPAPFGAGGPATGTVPVELGAPAAPGVARTHYAVDLQAAEGALRIVVLDNAPGSLAAADAYQNPPEPQAPWLQRVLADARAAGTPVVVMGSRSLNAQEPDPTDRARAAGDATAVATLLRDGGASAYVYDAPEKQLSGRIPAGSPDAIPSFGSGTLGYRRSNDVLDFGVPALTMLEVDAAARDAATNRAPVEARLIPVIEELALEAVDGRILSRSQPALFRGLGRRPRSGDRDSRSVLASSPYVQLPLVGCAGGCAGRLEPEVRFGSSDPDIADFVRQDPASTNARKPFVDPATDKPVADTSSGLLCAFNAGTTTISVASAGIAYSTTVTVRGGSVRRPCGTVPLAASRFPAAAPSPDVAAPVPAPAGGAAQPSPSVDIPLPPPAPPAAVAAAPVVTAIPFVPTPGLATPPTGTPLPPPSASPRPIPPSGTSPVSSTSSVLQPATRVEKEREEEIAPEQQQSAVRYRDGDTRLIGGTVIGLVLCAALAGSSLRRRPRGRDRGEELAFAYNRTNPRGPWRSE